MAIRNDARGNAGFRLEKDKSGGGRMVGMKWDKTRDFKCVQNLDEACSGIDCAAWRVLPLMVDAKFVAAVSEVMKRTNPKTGKNIPHATAAKYVADNRAEFGLPTTPTHGYCGLAGKPEA